MAKKGRNGHEDAARRGLADAQAKLQSAQERRARAITKREEELASARLRADARVDRATKEVERRAAKAARAEARITGHAKQSRGHDVRRADRATKSRSQAAEHLEPIDAEPAPQKVGAQVTATSSEGVEALAPPDARVLGTLRDGFVAAGATFTEWLNAAGVSRKTFLKARRELVARGLVNRRGEGQGARYFPSDR
jgi:hypothetical protein